MSSSAEKAKKSQLIKDKAIELGFFACGISKVCFLEEEAPHFEKWLKDYGHAGMSYLDRNINMRLDPGLLLEGAASVISVLYSYYPECFQNEQSHYKISKFAYGKDYHKVLKKKLFALSDFIQNTIGQANTRAFVDTAPLLERAWAVRGGLGWIGKNCNLLTLKNGSFFFIGELITDLELSYDQQVNDDYCGSCTLCVNACPTQAIKAPYHLDASRCISYLTIELKENIPEEFKGKYQHWIFGCDICQDVCPWNKFSVIQKDEKFLPLPEPLELDKIQWENLTEKKFNDIFNGSAVKRTKYQGLQRNIAFLT